MFAVALRRRDRHELIGQLFRIIVAAPGSVTGKYPVGNTGGADVSAFAPMPIPDDLRPLLPEHRGGIVNHSTHDTATDLTATFSTDVAGLDDATRPEVVELDDGDTVRAADRAGREAAWRRPCPDALLQRLDPGPDVAGAAGIGGHRARPQRR